MAFKFRTKNGPLSLATLAGLCLALVLAGCPGMPDGGNGNTNTNTNTNGSGAITGEIVSVRTDRQVSALEDFISILYNLSNVPTGSTVTAFRVAATGTPPNVVEVGDRTTLATGLPAGNNRAFQFEPSEAGAGTYLVGLTVTTPSNQETDILSAGRLFVLGPPDPQFIQPVNETNAVTQGTSVFISFDCNDPEDDAEWRLFLLSSTDSRTESADQLGTQLATGSGNVGSYSLDTSDLALGDYQLGIAATDSGDSIARTVARGEEDRIIVVLNGPIIRVEELISTSPPSIAVTAPAGTDVTLFRNEAYTVQFQAELGEPATSAFLEVFYDNNNAVTDGFVDYLPGAENLPVTTTSAAFPTDLPEGTYYVGATIRQQGQIAVTDYAAGRIKVVRQATLAVSEPSTLQTIAPSSPSDPNAESVTVRWTTNVPTSSAKVDVYARRLDIDGQVTGPEIPILTDAPLTTMMTEFSSVASGLFRMFVRIDFNDPLVNDIVASAALPVRVTSIPTILWLGALEEDVPEFDGAIFEGANFEDNAGSALAPAGDLNGDGFDEFVIAARYAKPFFNNPSGIGPGEGYLVYGASGTSRLLGLRNLNSVGTPGLRGITLTGIPTIGDSSETDGLSDVTQIPDADGDGRTELAFGFPYTDSASGHPLEASGQFLNGGVVILSSDNSILEDPLDGTPVIALANVGQRFTSTANINGTLPLVEDRLRFEAANPDANPPTPAQCVAGTDGIPDTVVGPDSGFSDVLAPSLLDGIGFDIIPPGTPPAEGVCVTQFALPCAGFYSGFYVATTTALEPRGARLIGGSEGDAFGTSVSASLPGQAQTRADLIVSAPERSALPQFVDGLTGTIANSGVAYVGENRDLWSSSVSPPTPHQYQMGFESHCGDGRAPTIAATRIAGNTNDRIRNVIGIDDFNLDGRNDIAIGAPTANGGTGRVYVAFRRELAIEGDFILSKLERAPTDPERLTGVLVVSQSISAFGASLETGVDFNGDGASDLVVGAPDAEGGVGEVVIIFGDPNLVTPQGGISVQSLLTTRNASGQPRAVRIRGNILDAGGNFGFNVANAGDLDGDGAADLLVSAPGATPRFDPDPTDAVDELTEPGVDRDFDGVADADAGALTASGLVYVIYGSNRLDQIRTCSTSGQACSTNADCGASETCTQPTDMTINIDQLGALGLQGFMVAGSRQGDRIGGGDAGSTAQGGIAAKSGRGRSFGLSSAGDVDGDGRDDFLIGSVLADPRRDPNTGMGVQNAGEAYLIYGSVAP